MTEPLRIAVLGASGPVGRRVVALALARGHRVRAQTRDAARLAELSRDVEIVAGEPADGAMLRRLLAGCDAVIYAIGFHGRGATTVFSDSTRALLAAMAETGVRRLVAVTGVGAGETRGHGGWLYDRVIFPLFTRNFYADKDRQEALIAASDTDWTIVRPAPFVRTGRDTPLEIHAEVGADTVLRGITRDEVARVLVDLAESGARRGERLFVGHP